MEEKLTLGLPDAQAAIAPINKYREKEESKSGPRKFFMPLTAFSALAMMFAKTEPGARNQQPEAKEQEPEQPSNDDYGIIEDVTAFLQTLASEAAAPEAGEQQPAVRLSFRTSTFYVTDMPPRLQRTVLSGTANDNLRSIIDTGEGFEFPALRPPVHLDLPSRATRGTSASGAPSSGNRNPDDQDDPDPNRAPVSLGRYTFSSGFVNLSALVMLDDLLAHMYDPDGDKLSINDISVSSGQIRAYGQDMWLYTPQRGYIGDVTFTYDVSDGQAEIRTGALFNLRKAPPHEIQGTEGADTLTGTPGEDLISGLGGSDLIYGREGDDIISGDGGDDVILGGDGADTLYGGAGNDTLFGGAGNDVLFGGDGDDRLFGEAGNDTLIAGHGNDALSGGTGADRLFGEDGDDSLLGEAGDDYLDGGDGDDAMTGGSGNDVVIAGKGNDTIRAGLAGEEARMAAATAHDGNDSYSGGEGIDTYDMSSARKAVAADLSLGTASGEEIGSDRLVDIENLTGGAGDDTLTGSDTANILAGADGDDTLCGKDGDDTISGGNGDDTFVVLARSGDRDDDDDGDDHYSGDDGFDTLDLAALVQEVIADLEAQLAEGQEIGRDTIEGFEAVIGGAGDDRLSGNSAANILVGGNGNDRLSGRAGDDVLTGGDGDDIVSGDSGDDIVLVAVHAADDGRNGRSDGDDSYQGGDGFDTYSAAGAVHDVIIDLDQGTATGIDIGDDTLAGFEAAIGGSGADFIIAGDGLNFLAGGAGDDVFVFRSLSSIANDGDGRDQIRDFAVGDRIDFSGIAASIGGLVFGTSDTDGPQQPVNRIMLYHESFEDGDRTIVKAIIDFERDEDFEILLYGRHELTEQDFILAARDTGADGTAPHQA
ncbi:cadherin-like domain-containing protein [Rhizobium sp. RAF36]|uniref:cadherin-like domain-containing protein n=1 Tax=Rhizobium sp. RAF36 TaxID=3233055 RepID=UPI003F968441